MGKDFKNKKLYRSQSNKMIAGVCGGIADYFEIDPTLIRLIVVAIALFGGVGLLAYIVGKFINYFWIIFSVASNGLFLRF